MRAFIPDFDLVTGNNLGSVLQLLGSGEGWRPIAGATDLMVLLNAGKLPWTRLVSVRELPELQRIEVLEDEIEIGAAVTYTQIRSHPALQAHFPMLCEAAGWTGGIANQNRGTLGGNIINASPAADSAPALLVYGAILEIASMKNNRSVLYSEFHTGYKKMRIAPDELLTCIRLPLESRRWRTYTRKVGTRKAQAISKVCFAGVANLAVGRIEDIRIALGSVAPVPLRCTATERSLTGKTLNSNTINVACEALHSEIQPIDDIRSTANYRRQVSENLLIEFLNTLQ
jgi:CO/xanthine dehydrogenase FAD-binding subunit